MTPADKLEVEKVLRDNQVALYIPKSAYDQVMTFSSTALEAITGNGASIIVEMDPSLKGIDIKALRSGPFDRVDMLLLELSKVHRYPLITLDRKMRAQVGSVPERRRLWGTVIILTPPFP
jgi:hypothetical protein